MPLLIAFIRRFAMPPEAVGLTIFFGLAGVFVVVFIGRLIARHEEAKLLHARELQAAEHEERLAMIERGIAPEPEIPTQKANREQAVLYSLSSVAVAACVFAWLSGGGWAAWLATGAIGVACVVGSVRIYMGTGAL
jgi:hypothetical protein